jgi:hypothetical protein
MDTMRPLVNRDVPDELIFWRRTMSLWILRALAAFLLAVPIAAAAEPMDDLLRRVPDQANALLAIDVGRMYTSPIAVTHNWKKEHERDYVSVAAGIPPHTRRLVVAAMLEPTTLEPSWRMGVAEFQNPVTLAKLTQTVPGSEDEVDGVPVALSSSNAYLVSLGPNLIGKMSPPNRQGIGRWIRSNKRPGESKLSPYLTRAVEGIGTKVDAVLAFDLSDMLDAKGLSARLNGMKALEKANPNIPDLVQELAGIEGITFTLVFDQKINGRLQFDFRSPPKTFAPLAKVLLGEALDALGMPMLDVNNWSSQLHGKSVVMEGDMSDRDLRKLGALLLPSTPRMQSEGLEGTSAAPDTAELTRKYFRSVTTLVEDLRAEKSPTFSKLAGFFQQYAKKIDDLPVLNVDPEVVAYGAQVASTFRALATNARGTNRAQNVISATQQEVTVDAGGAYSYGYGTNGFGAPVGWNYYRPNYQNVNNYQQVTVMRAAAGANEAAVRDQVWKQLDDTTSALRRKLTAKYKIEF